MSFSPIDDFRLRFNRMAKRRGLASPSTKRLAQALEQLLTEWYQAMPPHVLSAQTLQAVSAPDAAKLKQRYTAADANGDAPAMAGLLPLLMQIDRRDPDRPQMLNCCAVAALRLAGSNVPPLVEVVLEEAVATATPYSRTQLSALRNLAALYRQTGRNRAAYELCRMLLRQRRAFTDDPEIYHWIYYILAASARWLGKAQLAYRVLVACTKEPLFYARWKPVIDTGLFSLRAAKLPLPEAKHWLQSLYPESPYQPYLLGSYAGTLLAQGHPRAALALASRALTGIGEEHSQDLVTRMELHIIMAAACHRLGRPEIANHLLDQARAILGPAEMTRPATVRMQDWLPLAANSGG